MDKYVGTKIIKAEPIKYKDFCIKKYGEFKDETDFQKENKYKDGYLVQYENNYISWSPKDVFEKAYKKINNDIVKELESDIITKSNTFIKHDAAKYKSSNNYFIFSNAFDDEYINLLTAIHFQEGPVAEVGVNGVFMEDVIAIVIDRLQQYQATEFSCRENSIAITKLEESLMWLNKRTTNRHRRGVHGRSLI